MKALLSVEVGGPAMLQLKELPEQELEPGQLRVRVSACGINYPDVLIIEDRYQFRPERPFAPGCEISGIVEAVGPDVEGWHPGDHLLAIMPYGGLAEQLVIEAKEAIAVPKDLDLIEGSALLFTYGTALHALTDRGGLQAGETLFVLGAAGGVGIAAVELGKVLGAKVIAAVSSEEKAQAVRSAGADIVVVYPHDLSGSDAMRALAHDFKEAIGNHGADVIFDPVGGLYAEPALRSIAWGGRYLTVGFPAGIPKIPLNLVLLKGCDVRGVFWGAFAERDKSGFHAEVSYLISLWSKGRIRPRIDKIYSLDEGGDAITRLASRAAVGKVIVSMARK